MKQLYQAFIITLMFILAGCSYSITEAEATTFPGNSDSIVETSTVEPSVTDEPTIQTDIVSTQPQIIVQPEPKDDDFVRVLDYIPDIVLDLRYTTQDNFTGRQIYDFSELWLRYGTVKKLMLVQEELTQRGLSLKIWDGFRPPSAQFKLWEVYPDPAYVANPNNGFSSHSRGNTVDLTIVYADGTEVLMPTGFDDFCKRADRDYSDCNPEAASNAQMLEHMMKQYGFKPYSGEWWHFSDTQSYPIDHSFEPCETAWYYADCNVYISLRTHPDTCADTITTISTNEEFQVFAFHGEFALIEYQSVLGYVLRSHIQPVA